MEYQTFVSLQNKQPIANTLNYYRYSDRSVVIQGTVHNDNTDLIKHSAIVKCITLAINDKKWAS